MYREGMKGMLKALPDIQVIGEASNGQEALVQVATLHPDVVLMDVSMPIMDGVEATKLITGDHPNVKVLAVSVSEAEEDILDMIGAGAAGYVLKAGEVSELANAIRAAAGGKLALNRSLAEAIVMQAAASPRRQRFLVKPTHDLTERELEVLRLVVEGLTNKEVAKNLNLSDGTVGAHLDTIFRKLQVQSRTEAVVHAIRLGLVEV